MEKARKATNRFDSKQERPPFFSERANCRSNEDGGDIIPPLASKQVEIVVDFGFLPFSNG